MREHFHDITRLCAECQSLIDCHDKIAVLAEVHYNLRKTLQVGGSWAGSDRVGLDATHQRSRSLLSRDCGVSRELSCNCRMWRT